MTKKEIISNAINTRKLCTFETKFEKGLKKYVYPIMMSDKLFIGADEQDFMLDGYTIRRFKDIKKVKIKKDFYYEMEKREGITDSISVPNMDLINWQSVFNCLKKANKNIIVECEKCESKNSYFDIGRIEKLNSKFMCFRRFDADGIWENESVKIIYKDVTSVTVDSRYITVFSKYLTDVPELEN